MLTINALTFEFLDSTVRSTSRLDMNSAEDICPKTQFAEFSTKRAFIHIKSEGSFSAFIYKPVSYLSRYRIVAQIYK